MILLAYYFVQFINWWQRVMQPKPKKPKTKWVVVDHPKFVQHDEDSALIAYAWENIDTYRNEDAR